MNYEKLMAKNPTLLHTQINQLGQEIQYYEHPIYGEDYHVIAVSHEHQKAVLTDFYDTGDFYEDSEYNYTYKDGEFDCAFEFEQ